MKKKEATTKIINESMITLLIKILQKRLRSTAASKKNFIPLFEFKKEINESRVGGEHYFISNLLNKAALLSFKCKKAIESALKQINGNLSDKQEYSDEELK